MPHIYALNRAFKHKNRLNFGNIGLRRLNNPSLLQCHNQNAQLDKQSSEQEISSTVQCRTRAFKTLKHLFDITTLTTEQEELNSQKLLFGIQKPNFVSQKNILYQTNIENLKQLNKNNSKISDNELYKKQLRARISILAPQCTPKQIGIILSKFFQSNIEKLLLNELEFLNKLIIESGMKLNDTILHNLCLGNATTSTDNTLTSLIVKISKFISSKHPNITQLNINQIYYN